MVVGVDGQPVATSKRPSPPHALRHTCASWMAQDGVPIREITGYRGHSIAHTTELYAHHHPAHQQRAKAALSGGSVANSVADRSKTATRRPGKT